MAQTDVKHSELDESVRRFKLTAQIEEPTDGQQIIFDLAADWAYEIELLRTRVNDDTIQVDILVAGVAVAGLDGLTLVAGAYEEHLPSTARPLVIEGQQVRADLNIPTGDLPTRLILELVCIAAKDQTLTT